MEVLFALIATWVCLNEEAAKARLQAQVENRESNLPEAASFSVGARCSLCERLQAAPPLLVMPSSLSLPLP
eukprot:scaffold438_cov250-Pinguiococcus_pyrenoidosus.AAC.3